MAALLITGAMVWDGVSDTTSPHQVLVIDGRIRAVGESVEAPREAQVVDLSGHTLTPGFMDCHTHVTLTPDLRTLHRSSAQNALNSIPVLRTFLTNGFTTVRDLCGADIDPTTIFLRDAVAAGIVEEPRMLVAPHIISARGGTAISARWSPISISRAHGGSSLPPPTDVMRSAPGCANRSEPARIG